MPLNCAKEQKIVITWQEQLLAHAAAHADADALPDGVSSSPCTSVFDVSMGKTAADVGVEQLHLPKASACSAMSVAHVQAGMSHVLPKQKSTCTQAPQ